MMNGAYVLYGTLDAFIASYFTTGSYDKLAARRTSEIEKLGVGLRNLGVSLAGFIGGVGKDIGALVKFDRVLAGHEFFLRETAEQSKYLMSEAEEKLAAELSLSGGQAFGKLQGVVSSQLKVPVRIGKEETMPISKVRNLAYDADEKVRKAA